MFKIRKIRSILWMSFSAAFAMMLVFGQLSAEAAGVADLYKSKTLRIMTSNKPGGGFDFYMRTTAKYMEKTSGIRVACENVPGAGGTLGDNRLFLSKPDGLTIGLINYPGHVFAQIQEQPGVKYDFKKWEWIGRVAGIPPAIGISTKSDIKSMEDFINAKKETRFGLEGKGSDAYYGTVFLENVLKAPIARIVGYGGPGEIAGAMMAGEIDARFESIDSLMPAVKSGDLRILVIFDSEKDSRVPDVPIVSELALDASVKSQLDAFGNIYKLERSFVAPPGTPKENVDFIRDAIWKAWNDEGFQKEMKGAGRGLQLMRGEELAKESMKVAAEVDSLSKLFKE
jgi:tripartite-type tricarboxylate transporter receptor subunit TctC